MPIAKIVSHYQGSADANPFTTSALDTTAGGGATAIFVAISDYGGNPASTLTDSESNSYGSPITVELLAGNVRLQTWAIANPATDASHTFIIASSYAPSIAVLVLLGTALASVVDQFSDAQSLGNSTVQPGSITPSQAGAIVVTTYASAFVYDSVSAPFSPVDGSVAVSAEHMALALAFEIQTTPTARNPTWASSSAGNHMVSIVSLKAPAVATADLNLRLDEPIIGASTF